MSQTWPVLPSMAMAMCGALYLMSRWTIKMFLTRPLAFLLSTTHRACPPWVRVEGLVLLTSGCWTRQRSLTLSRRYSSKSSWTCNRCVCVLVRYSHGVHVRTFSCVCLHVAAMCGGHSGMNQPYLANHLSSGHVQLVVVSCPSCDVPIL